MKVLYTVHHWDTETMEDDEHDKLIGIYSTRELADAAVAQLRDKPGFRDCPADFWFVGPVTLDEIDAWSEGFVRVGPHNIAEFSDPAQLEKGDKK